ncbi:MAG: hypothetical protein M1839_004748 [Geoglossum umbratile]|nr:MAG: hypothetical protein M1839_004748 [Geoglossum umbratile]
MLFQLDTLRRVSDTAQCVNFALNGNIEGLKYLFSHGLAPPRDVSTTRGYSLLRWALYGKQYQTCEFLVYAGADPDYRPIATSDKNPRNKACHFLLEGGLSNNAIGALQALTKGSHFDDFIDEADFTQAHRIVLGLSMRSLEEEILLHPEDINAADAMGRTPIAWAAARGDRRAVVTLLSHGADPNATDIQCSGPLSNAAAQGHTVCVRLLLEAGAHPDPTVSRTEKKGSPLNCAARNAADVLLLKSLLDFGADIESGGVDGKTALIHTARTDNASFALLLLEYGADINATSTSGPTPLTTAITYNSHNEGKGAGWRDWPKDAQEKEVLEWFKKLIDMFLEIHSQLDIGFANGMKTNESLPYDWSQILVPGELKSNPNADRRTDTWLDLARYARHVLTTQDTRRYVLGFTLCGSIMRLWEFDRLGGIASSAFDVNKEGLQFVSAVLGYLLMDKEQLGFDPTITESDGKRYMEITRNGETERLVLVELMKRHSSVAGRATTCWKAYRDGDELMVTLVIKDSWQYPERGEEGELLRNATEKNVVNVARYYHHETVRVGGKEDDINDNIRKGLGIMKATDAFRHISASSKAEGLAQSRSTSGAPVGGASRSRSTARKRSSSSLNAPLPLNKRSCSASPHEGGERSVLPNRIHRRVILRDYGKNIYKASSRVAMLAALEGNIEGHESLRNLTGIIQSDISKGNLMMNEDKGNSSWPSFLIDLDLAIQEDRDKSSGAPKKTGTRAFMAIGALYGENHSFMHDLESFFWVLFWICIHYNRPNKESRIVPKFEKWNYEDMDELAEIKSGIIADESHFLEMIRKHFTSYYQSLVPWINRLRRVVFPMDKPWKREDKELYSQIQAVLEKARSDSEVSAEYTLLRKTSA